MTVPNPKDFVPAERCGNCWRWDETPRDCNTPIEHAMVKTHDYGIGYCDKLQRNTFAQATCGYWSKL